MTKSLIKLSVVGAVVIMLLALIMSMMGPQTFTVNFNDGTSINSEVYASYVAGLLAEYQVDVFYNNAGVVGTKGSQAMRCLSEKGSWGQSSFLQNNGLTHIPCFGPENNLFIVILARIIEGDSQFKNPKTQLFQAGEVNMPEHVAQMSQKEQVKWYFRQVKAKWGGETIKLDFAPGDIAFFPVD